MKSISRKPLKRRLMNYFLQGLLYISPLGITVFILYSLFRFVDGLLRSSIQSLFGVDIPGLGLVIIVMLVTLLGYVGQTVIAQPVKKQIPHLLKQTPFLQSIYMTAKDFVEAFLGKEKKFVYPVLVKLDRSSDMEKIGFLTQTDLSELKIKDKVAVYFPQSYSWSGDLFIVPSENVTPLDISPGDAMKFAVTGGVTKVTE
jgi:uncharacterized membrane protein